MIQQLVVNGCSYMESYAQGGGHVDLARQLGFVGKFNIPHASTLAIGGSANNRILRTTLKHAANNSVPTLYVLGMTFVSRTEIPILIDQDPFEGRWTNPQNQYFKDRWEPLWTNLDHMNYMDLMLKWEANSLLDRTEDLMYRMISAKHMLLNLGHRVLMFQQADTSYWEFLQTSRFKLLNSCPEIMHGFEWASIPWQHRQGVAPTDYNNPEVKVPLALVHPAPGHHQQLNQYLTNYIQEYKILQ
jgi:hypothetical protein